MKTTLSYDEKFNLLEKWESAAKYSKFIQDHLDFSNVTLEDMQHSLRYWKEFSNFTNELMAILNDDSEWLEWYVWENNLGKNKLIIKDREIVTLNDLLWVIDQRRNENE